MSDKPPATQPLVTPHATRQCTKRNACTRSGRGNNSLEVGFGSSGEINNRLRMELAKLQTGGNRYDKKNGNDHWQYENLVNGPPTKKVRVDSPQATESPVLEDKVQGETIDLANSPQVEEANVEDSNQSSRVSKVPDPSRYIVEADQLRSLISSAAVCARCGKRGKLQLDFKTVCLAAIMRLTCQKCGAQTTVEPQMTSFGEESRKNDKRTYRNRDYSTNVCFVTAFTACGDGPAEAERLCTLLGLSNATTMAKQSYNKIEAWVWPSVQEIVEDAMRETLDEIMP
ncbi:hypothetical protein SEMRO_215_G089140.1 [Seminavis robusta]|uniref:Mutator-like transposase domain-containing protein n=1 Tax=Seminavis robusta TaxID=568900 RepID=A0A9N8HCE2_9STRA|nr:hypothetical protein SEMRO_215_G089140.1 [Seminavis robusta]|eukprot:Sro215_g089140.1 n/a (285) ;mRNA; f:77140-77994